MLLKNFVATNSFFTISRFQLQDGHGGIRLLVEWIMQQGFLKALDRLTVAPPDHGQFGQSSPGIRE